MTSDRYYSGDIEKQLKDMGCLDIPSSPEEQLLLKNRLEQKREEQKREEQKREEEENKIQINNQENKILQSKYKMEFINYRKDNIILTKKEKNIIKKNTKRLSKKLDDNNKKYREERYRNEKFHTNKVKLLNDLEKQEKIKLESNEIDLILNKDYNNDLERLKSYTIEHMKYKKKYNLKELGLKFEESEIRELWNLKTELIRKVKKNYKFTGINNLNDVKLELINIQLDQKRIPRKTSIEEAEKDLECMNNKMKLAKIMNMKYEEIDKYPCEYIQGLIDTALLDSVNFNVEYEQKKIADKLPRASKNLAESNG